MKNRRMPGFDGIVTPEEWRTELLSHLTEKKYAHCKPHRVFAAVLTLLIVLAATVTAFAAASPQFREWLLSVLDVTQCITRIDGAVNIVRTHDLGDEYLVEDGFIVTNEGSPDQQVFEYADGRIQNSDIRTFEGTYGQGAEAIRFSFQYAKNGTHLYAYGYEGNADFTVQSMNAAAETAAVYLYTPPHGILLVVGLETGDILREIKYPGKLKDFMFGNNGTSALLKLSTQREGNFEWYLINVKTGAGRYIEPGNDPYDAYFYDDAHIIFMSYDEEEGGYLPVLYQIEKDSLFRLDAIPAKDTVPDSFPYAISLEGGACRFRSIVDHRSVSFAVNELFAPEDIDATFGGDRFFFCEYGGDHIAIFDLQNEIMTSLQAADFASDFLLFVSLLDENTLLVCGEKAEADAPSFYLVQLER